MCLVILLLGELFHMNETVQYCIWYDGLVHSFNEYYGIPPSINTTITFKGIDYRVRDVIHNLDTQPEHNIINVRVVVEEI